MKLQKAIIVLNESQLSSGSDSILSDIDTRALIVVTIIYLVTILSLPLEYPGRIIWLAVYPIIMSPMCGISYSKIFRKSLYVLPFIFLIGIFNPIYDQRIAFTLYGLPVSIGWLTFLSILIRGTLAMQALLILIHLSGFLEICSSLQRLGIPQVLCTQLLMLYRYIGVLMQEANRMYNSAVARGYGKKSFPIQIWSFFTGSLLLRSYEKSKRIHNAMLARGFNGTIVTRSLSGIKPKDIVFILTWCLLFLGLYFFDISKLIF